MTITDSIPATITTLPIFPDWLGCENPGEIQLCQGDSKDSEKERQ